MTTTPSDITAASTARGRAGVPGSVFILCAILAFNLAVTPNFLKVDTLWAMLLQSFPIIIMSLGMALVMATGGLDISVGSSMAVASVLFAKLAVDEGWSAFAAFLPALGAVLVIGAANGLIVGLFRMPSLIITLATLLIGQGLAASLADGRIITFFEPELVGFARHRLLGVIPVHVAIMAAVVVVVALLVRKTNFGICLQAVGDDAAAAGNLGIRTACVLTAVYAANALLAGTAALFETARLASSDTGAFGAQAGFDCITAVILGGAPLTGGRARIAGTLVGALIMQSIATTVNMNNLPHAYTLVFTAAVLAFALLSRRKARP